MPSRVIWAMRYALDVQKRQIEPFYSGQRAICPGCGGEVIGKCGSIVSDHWSHLSGSDCDPWQEPETNWHIEWQNLLKKFRNAKIETVITKDGISHRADAALPNGRIYELQHSGISPEQIHEREQFYGKKLVWVFDTIEAYISGRIDIREKENGNCTFRWKHPRKSIAYAKRKVFLDFGLGELFELEWMSKETPCGGKGKLIQSATVADFTIFGDHK